ncbi:hypothetical protein ONS95_000212 [Cadophora gregata]|uniref:uncharacterized protein n=1 Tax=Cadophora gregata TaxID=51156 RepID=UPI0026DCD769|nr:uncharacterized protein ONS95_000212 [Cadophora gregata]KAK0115511.1 hypothetical protein ONS96_013964 [Cadophora gregata f. sp. sojae]KAK0128235.1 hypothetical protein ONS95_000212 [Cadophora gregata]
MTRSTPWLHHVLPRSSMNIHRARILYFRRASQFQAVPRIRSPIGDTYRAISTSTFQRGRLSRTGGVLRVDLSANSRRQVERYRTGIMAPPRVELEKQYMSTKAAKKISEPRPSASILLISPKNQILLLHRVRTSSSFPSAHVFPGGNLSPSDGHIPAPNDKDRHVDGRSYRIGAIRECFEESGILLARRKDGVGLLEVEDEVREKGRRDVHEGKIAFEKWVEGLGGVVDIGEFESLPFFSLAVIWLLLSEEDIVIKNTDSLHPFSRWITPTNVPKRFTTQMYIYFLPLTQDTTSTTTSSSNSITESVIPPPTSDGGLEHTAALFAPCSTWLSRARKNEIILFPPQFYLMYLLAPFLTPLSTPSQSQLQAQRDSVLEFLKGDGGDGKGITWADKVMSPTGLLMRKSDGRSVLALDKPGPELKGSTRGGDEERVVLVKFGKEGPRDVDVRWRREVLGEERDQQEVGKDAKL